MLGGFLVAIAAALAFETAYVLQALEARRAGGGDERLRLGLLGRLLRRPLWLAATALGGVGAALQVLALTLAPLTLVQPTLALGLVALLLLARSVLHETVGRREWLAVGTIIVGVIGVALLTDEDATAVVRPIPTAVLVVVLVAITLAPYAGRRADSARVRVAAAAAGDALAAIALALLAIAIEDGRWLPAVGWAALAAGGGALALNAEMGALQRLSAARVAPLILAAQVVVPVIAAPLALGEPWGTTVLGAIGLGLAVALVTLGAVLLGASRAIGDVLTAGHEVEDHARR